jgi:hypothetical protein
MNSIVNEQKRDEVVARINRLQPDAKAEWGRMNCGQMICHLTDPFRHALGEREWSDQSNVFKRTFLKWLVLHVLSMPKNVPTPQEVDQEKNGTKPGDFETDRAVLIDYIDKFAATPADHKWNSHAAFGPLNKTEWDILAYKHLDHHLRQFNV